MYDLPDFLWKFKIFRSNAQTEDDVVENFPSAFLNHYEVLYNVSAPVEHLNRKKFKIAPGYCTLKYSWLS